MYKNNSYISSLVYHFTLVVNSQCLRHNLKFIESSILTAPKTEKKINDNLIRLTSSMWYVKLSMSFGRYWSTHNAITNKSKESQNQSSEEMKLINSEQFNGLKPTQNNNKMYISNTFIF